LILFLGRLIHSVLDRGTTTDQAQPQNGNKEQPGADSSGSLEIQVRHFWMACYMVCWGAGVFADGDGTGSNLLSDVGRTFLRVCFKSFG
jgi:hypothetical protein